jgi:hypothetical protein
MARQSSRLWAYNKGIGIGRGMIMGLQQTENKIDGITFIDFVETVRLIFNKPDGDLKELIYRLRLARNMELVHSGGLPYELKTGGEE